MAQAENNESMQGHGTYQEMGAHSFVACLSVLRYQLHLNKHQIVKEITKRQSSLALATYIFLSVTKALALVSNENLKYLNNLNVDNK
jgi:hypothetical protein